eukprot:2425825-Rhodomonas_salina.1
MPPKSAAKNRLGAFKASAELCSQFCAITGADHGLAGRLLGLSNGNIDQAVNMFLDSPRAKWANAAGTTENPVFKRARVDVARDAKKGGAANAEERVCVKEQVCDADSEDTSQEMTIDLTNSGDEDENKTNAGQEQESTKDGKEQASPPNMSLREEPEEASTESTLVDMGKLECGCSRRFANRAGECGWYHSLPDKLEAVCNHSSTPTPVLSILLVCTPRLRFLKPLCS